MKPIYANIGTVSEGTLRDEDLIEAFSSELRYYMRRLRLTREQRKRFNLLLRFIRVTKNCTQDCDPHGVVDELYDALSELAPPYAYFGANEGDGADFGFWPMVDDDELPRYGDLSEAPREAHDCYVISDHGNVSCGHISARGLWREYWSAV